jgi:hypothetical protein
MSNARILGETRIDERFGRDAAASGAAGWLGLAAAPTFALMALWTAFFNDQATMLCMAIPSSTRWIPALMCQSGEPCSFNAAASHATGRLPAKSDQRRGIP